LGVGIGMNYWDFGMGRTGLIQMSLESDEIDVDIAFHPTFRIS